MLVPLQCNETVSCTVVLKKHASDSAVVVSQTFYDLHIPSNFVGNRASAKSIMIGTLLLLLQEALACGGFNADTTLARIIKQDPDFAGAICIATTRIPDFGEQISNPSHGFRSLCCLGTVTVRHQDIPPSFHPSYELLASKIQTDNPVAVCFAESFQPLGIDLISHFNVIFYPVPNHTSTAIPLLWARASTSPESSLSPWDSISAVQSRNASPREVDVTARLFQSTNRDSSDDVVAPPPASSPPHSSANAVIPSNDLPAPLRPQSLESEPQMRLLAESPQSLLSILSSSPLQSLPSPPLPLLLQSPPITLHGLIPNPENSAHNNAATNIGRSSAFDLLHQASENESTLTSSSQCSIPLVLAHHAIPDEKREAAIYQSGFKKLYLKVRNFNAMNLILDHMGYSLPFRLTTDPTIKVSNVAVKASDVLKYFGWAPISFEHKTVWYGAAEALLQCNWKNGVPALGTPEYGHYMLWQGICFLWGPCGSITTGIAPNAHSSNEPERRAATITQNQIQTAKKVLRSYLS